MLTLSLPAVGHPESSPDGSPIFISGLWASLEPIPLPKLWFTQAGLEEWRSTSQRHISDSRYIAIWGGQGKAHPRKKKGLLTHFRQLLIRKMINSYTASLTSTASLTPSISFLSLVWV